MSRGLHAARLGLINRAVPVNQLYSAIDACVTDLLAGGPEALPATKQLLTRVPTMSVEDALAWTAELSSLIFRSDEAREGIPAFLEKRPPSWIDRPQRQQKRRPEARNRRQSSFDGGPK